MDRRLVALLASLVMGGLAIAADPVKNSTEKSAKVEIVGHRGASWDAPENTLPSIKLAWDQRADGVEFDIHLTGDGKIVVCHDHDTHRTAGVKFEVAKTPLAELQKLDVGTWKDPNFAGEKMPTLEEVLATVPAGKKVYIEVKCGPEIVLELVKTLKASKLPPVQTPVISFKDKVIAAIKQAYPAAPAYWIYDLKKKASAEELIAKAKEIHADGLDLSARESLDQDFAAKVRAAGLRLVVWTVNDPDVAKRMIQYGVQGITTDRPGWMREQLGL